MTPRKILAIKLRAMGDTVLMTAPLAELKRAFPKAEIHTAVMARWAPLLETHPAVSKVWTYERHKEKASRAKALARLALNLRRERYDCVVNFHASPSSATLAFATGARTRSIHFHGHGDRNRYSTVQVPGKGTLKPNIERDMDAVRALGVHVPAGRGPQLHLEPAELRWASGIFSGLGMAPPILGLGIGASRPAKAWPLDRFAQVAVGWAKTLGGSVYAVTGPEEAAESRRFLMLVDDALQASVPEQAERAAVRSRITAEPGLTVRQLAALLSRVSVFLGNDSGPKHVAVAVDTPTVTLFGPEDPYEWHPYPKERHPYFFIESLACRRDAAPGMPPWCAVHDCIEEQHRCMRMIGVEAVLAECQRMLQARAS